MSVNFTTLLTPTIATLGFELWGITLIQHKSSTVLRVYIDSEQGVNVDDCAKVSRQISGVLDVENPFRGRYTLEVSSPGINRPLFTLDQFSLFIGHSVQVVLRDLYEGRRKFVGVLKAIEDGEIVLVIDDYEYLLPYEWVDKANLTGTVNRSK